MTGLRSLGCALLALCACVESRLVHCPDGTACSAGLVCADGRPSCVDADFCRDSSNEGARCEGLTFEDGVCFLGTCAPIVCGDGVNQREDCDDSNLASHDGCSSACIEEQLRGTDATPPGDLFSLLQDAGMVYVPGRGELLLFGGTDRGTQRNTLWRWDGVAWTDATPSTGSPPPRIHPAMAYDAARDRVVVFGGFGNGDLVDTWEWDGSTWHDVTPPSGSPPARNDAGMAYDSARQRVVMFSGQSNLTEIPVARDTWEWDGSTWTDVTPPDPQGSPPERFAHAMVYDMIRERIVLFGGSNNNALEDTWEWDGNVWTQRLTTPTPRAFAHQMVYDPLRGRVVLFGGQQPDELLDEVWEWDGTGWTEVRLVDSPGARSHHAMAYDSARARIVVVEGDFQPGGEVWHLQYQPVDPDDPTAPAPPDQDCLAGEDTDDDRLAGCEDPDCWAFCKPFCPPQVDCDPAAPHCGDGSCNSFLETTGNCPEDCP